MNFLEQLISHINQWIELVSSVAAILSFITGFMADRLLNYFKYYKCKKNFV